MSGLFLKYPSHNLVQINTINKVNLSTVIRLVTSIVPPKSTPLAYKAIENGFLITFRNDKDINSFFVPDNLSKLEQHNLHPTITPLSKNNREVYIPGVSKYSVSQKSQYFDGDDPKSLTTLLFWSLI